MKHDSLSIEERTVLLYLSHTLHSLLLQLPSMPTLWQQQPAPTNVPFQLSSIELHFEFHLKRLYENSLAGFVLFWYLGMRMNILMRSSHAVLWGQSNPRGNSQEWGFGRDAAVVSGSRRANQLETWTCLTCLSFCEFWQSRITRSAC